MKQETKELINWIKCQIATNTDESYKITSSAIIKYNETKVKAFNFLNSLEDIELRLCLGGYIQDRNGTPCCHGDKIKFKIYDNEWMSHLIEKYGAVTEGKLRWNQYMKAFCVDFGDGDWLDFTAANDGVEWFEKAER